MSKEKSLAKSTKNTYYTQNHNPRIGNMTSEDHAQR